MILLQKEKKEPCVLDAEGICSMDWYNKSCWHWVAGSHTVIWNHSVLWQ